MTNYVINSRTSEAADQGDHQVSLGDSQHPAAARDGGEIAHFQNRKRSIMCILRWGYSDCSGDIYRY